MNLIGIEITDMDGGQVRVLECECRKGRVSPKNGKMASFGTPFLSLPARAFKRFLRENGIRGRDILAILPEGTHRSILWTAEKPDALPDILDERKDELEITGNTVVKSSLYGRDEQLCYGTTTAIDNDVLDGFYRVFQGLNIKYLLPQTTAYTLLGRFWPDADAGLLDLKRDALTLAVYRRETLAWTVTASYIGDRENDMRHVCEAAVRALNAAKSSRYYPSVLYLAGDLSNTAGIGGLLSDALDTPCETQEYAEGFVKANSALSTLINVMRGLTA